MIREPVKDRLYRQRDHALVDPLILFHLLNGTTFVRVFLENALQEGLETI
jgi:hypothetical protein